MYELTLLRHAESQGNIEKRHQGQAEYPLTELGRQQAAALAARWRAEGVAFERIYASPLQRARLTAEAIQQALAAPLVFDELLVERHLGQLTGLTHEVASQQVPRRCSSPHTSLTAIPGKGSGSSSCAPGKCCTSCSSSRPANICWSRIAASSACSCTPFWASTRKPTSRGRASIFRTPASPVSPTTRARTNGGCGPSTT